MDAAHALVQRLAERIADDEVEIAPDLLDGYLAGERNDPAAAEPVLGGFDVASGYSIILAVLDGLRANADLISTVLGVGSAATGLLVNVISIRTALARKPAGAPDEAARTLLSALDSIERRLSASGVPAEKAPEIGRAALLTLLERPDDARRLLDSLATARA